MDLAENKREEILYHAQRCLHYNELLIKQCDSWLSAEEGNANFMREYDQKFKDSKIQKFKDSKIQRFKDLKIQRFKDSIIQSFKNSIIHIFKNNDAENLSGSK